MLYISSRLRMRGLPYSYIPISYGIHKNFLRPGATRSRVRPDRNCELLLGLTLLGSEIRPPPDEKQIHIAICLLFVSRCCEDLGDTPPLVRTSSEAGFERPHHACFLSLRPRQLESLANVCSVRPRQQPDSGCETFCSALHERSSSSSHTSRNLSTLLKIREIVYV